MDRCAVFVDAGYLHESAKTLLTAGHPGATVQAKAMLLVREIATLAVVQTELPLLRIYWYAAAPNRNPYPDQRELASLQDIKLRLGNLRERAGGRMVQKGVDAELHADMTGLARNRGAVDFVLLSGDEDLLRAVDEVQSYGVRVHLWGVESGPDGGNQSLELIAAADRRHVLEEAWLRNVFSIKEPPKPGSPMAAAGGAAIPVPIGGVPVGAAPLGAPVGAVPLGAPVGAAPGDTPAGPAAVPGDMPAVAVPHPGTDASINPASDQPAADPGTHPHEAAPLGSAETPAAASTHHSAAEAPAGPGGAPVGTPATTPAGDGAGALPGAARRPDPASIPKPTDLRPRTPAPPVRPPASTVIYTAPPGQPGYSPKPDYAFYRLSDLTTQAEQYADAAEDEAITYDAISVGKVYARRWLSRATSEAAALLELEYPTIPRAVDAELLRYAVNRGVDTWSSETDKFAVRQGFWVEVRKRQAEAEIAAPAPASN